MDDDEIRDVHSLSCDIWQTNDKPCNCQDPAPLTTAQRIGLLLTCDETYLQEGA